MSKFAQEKLISRMETQPSLLIDAARGRDLPDVYNLTPRMLDKLREKRYAVTFEVEELVILRAVLGIGED